MDKIIIKGAREHNLKNIDLEIPKNKLVVFTGLSGSGKSSLAFDTIYAEGQRRYVESLSSYARQFFGVMDKPDVDQIEGLSPAISIDQKSVSHNPRSTVGTVTEIYDYLRLLYARIGHPHCSNCGREISHLTLPQIVEKALEIIRQNKTKRGVRLFVLSPVVKARKGEFTQLFESLATKGYTKVRIDKKIYKLDDDFLLIKTNKHDVDVVVDRLVVTEVSQSQKRLSESIEAALNLSGGSLIISLVEDPEFQFPENPKIMTDHLFSEKFSCPVCNLSLPEIEPRTFSFNAPQGACPECTGLGAKLRVDPELVLAPELTISEGAIVPFSRMSQTDSWFNRLIEAVAKKYGFSTSLPLKNLEQKFVDLVLNGTGGETVLVQGTNRYGRQTSFETVYEGVLKNLARRHKETESDFMRSEIEKFMRIEPCPQCLGARLKKESLSITVKNLSIIALTNLSIQKILAHLQSLEKDLTPRENTIARPILKELSARLTFLIDVGLDYLTLSRNANTLAGGETQRIRLASQIGSKLTGVLYVLDEPSIGLHQKDNARLIATLKKLRDLGNTVIVVEHDREMMEESDYIFDFGPGAGEHGGKIVAQGTVEKIKKNKNSLTGQYLSGRKQISCQSSAVSRQPLPGNGKLLTLVGGHEHNLKNITVEFPLNKLICVTGVSGSGKSTLIHDILYHALMKEYFPFHKTKPGDFDSLKGSENLDKVILIDQSPIGRTPRSNPATYTGAFTFVRELFANTKDAKIRGYKAGRFSFNVKGGRCESCQGEGQIKIEMQFLPDIYVKCESCQGKRYHEEALEIFYKNKNIAEILEMTVEEAAVFFNLIPPLHTKLQTLYDVGLGYLRLGQPAPTLSGGEAQRIKLAAELSKRATGKTLYLLDEPSTGLHFVDLEKLLLVLRRLVENGNTVIVIEHNLDVIKNADWIIDMGPEGGDRGGEVVAQGTQKEVARASASYTGRYLAKLKTAARG